MALDLTELRRGMAEYMAQHPRASLDSAIFHILKVAYAKGLEDGNNAGRGIDTRCDEVHAGKAVRVPPQDSPEIWDKYREIREAIRRGQDSATPETAAIEELFHHGGKGV